MRTEQAFAAGPVEREGQRYWQAEIVVRWGDMDALGHVNNARFFTYDEDVRLGFFNAVLGAETGLWQDYGFILAHIGCDFIAQVKAPNRLLGRFGFRRMGGKSLHTQLEMYDGAVLAARSAAVVVCFDYQRQQTLALPDFVRNALSPYLLAEADASGAG